MKRKIALLLSLLMLAALLLTACGEAPKPSATPAPTQAATQAATAAASTATPAPKIPLGKNEQGKWIYLCFVIRSLSNPYHIATIEGIKNFAKQLGMTDAEVKEYVQPLVYDTSSEKMLQDIKTWNNKTDGNMVFGIDPAQITDLIAIADYCETEKIYWCSWEKPKTLNVSDYDYWVYALNPDNYTAGYKMADMLCSALGGKGNIWIGAGTAGHAAAIGRQEGIDACLKEKYPNIKVVGSADCKWEKNAGYTNASSALAAFQIDGIIGHSDMIALGALQAIREKNLIGKVKLVGNNGVPDMLTAIKAGEAVGTISNDPVYQGAMSIYAALKAKAGEYDFKKLGEDKRCWKYDVIQITPATVADYEKSLATPPDYLKVLATDMYVGKNLGPGKGL